MNYEFEDVSKRYPVEMHKYAQSTGALLAHRIGRIFQTIGYSTWVVKGQNNGIDMKVYDSNNNLIFVCEILNWSPYTRLSQRRKQRIIDNLSKLEYANARKLLIYTTMKDESELNDLWQYQIGTLKLGKQVLPQYFHKYYAIKKQVTDRVVDSKETTELITKKIRTLLRYLNIATNNESVVLTVSLPAELVLGK